MYKSEKKNKNIQTIFSVNKRKIFYKLRLIISTCMETSAPSFQG